MQDKSEKWLAEEQEVFSRWTEYCSGIYNPESHGDYTILNCNQPPEEELAALKIEKSAGIDNIPGELCRGGGETMTDISP